MAKRSAAANLSFYQHDMRRAFGKEAYDYVFNFFTSFGYFKAAEENQQVVQNIAQALKPGGTLVLDYLNVHYSEQQQVSNEEKEIDGIVTMLREKNVDGIVLGCTELPLLLDEKVNEADILNPAKLLAAAVQHALL